MAATATGNFLPAALSRRYRVHSRSCAFQAISRTGFGRPSMRARSVCPSGFNQGPASASIARKGQPLAFHRVAGRALCRRQAEKRHELSRRFEPAHIADFRGKGDGNQERGTAHRLIRRNHWRHGPTGHDECQLLFQAMQSLRSVLDRVDAFLEHDLLRCMLERLPGEPTPMRQRPMTAAAADPPTTQQERKQLLAFAT